MNCPSWDCDRTATHALAYGCLNGHINSVVACTHHASQYIDAIRTCHCGVCQLPYEGNETLVLMLPQKTR